MTPEQLARVETIKNDFRRAKTIAEVDAAARLHAMEVQEMSEHPTLYTMAIQIRNLAAWQREGISKARTEAANGARDT